MLGGLTRVRAIQLNDAHIFCRLDQVAEEAGNALALISRAYSDMGISAVPLRPGAARRGREARRQVRRRRRELGASRRDC